MLTDELEYSLGNKSGMGNMSATIDGSSFSGNINENQRFVVTLEKNIDVTINEETNDDN